MGQQQQLLQRGAQAAALADPSSEVPLLGQRRQLPAAVPLSSEASAASRRESTAEALSKCFRKSIIFPLLLVASAASAAVFGQTAHAGLHEQLLNYHFFPLLSNILRLLLQLIAKHLLSLLQLMLRCR